MHNASPGETWYVTAGGANPYSQLRVSVVGKERDDPGLTCDRPSIPGKRAVAV